MEQYTLDYNLFIGV